MKKYAQRYAWFLGVFVASTGALAVNDAFNIKSLPKGKEVTLPRPAVTIVPVSETISVGSTDMPQSIKLSAISGGPSFTVAIHDTQAKAVKRVELKPGMTYLYSFKDLGNISIIPESGVATNTDSQSLRIESNKPLTISR